MPGYSGTPLAKKLGIKPAARLALAHAPGDFGVALGELPVGVTPVAVARSKGPFDVIVAFFDAAARFAKELPKLEQLLDPAGGLWIAWPKRASGVATDMDENVVRRCALPRGLVDNKVCAIDATWSGLRLVVRLENRPTPKRDTPAPRARKPATEKGRASDPDLNKGRASDPDRKKLAKRARKR